MNSQVKRDLRIWSKDYDIKLVECDGHSALFFNREYPVVCLYLKESIQRYKRYERYGSSRLWINRASSRLFYKQYNLPKTLIGLIELHLL